MKRMFFVFCCSVATLLGASSQLYIGSHFNYVRLKFNNPAQLRGYMSGIKAGYTYCGNSLYSGFNMEAYWNAGPITGRPSQRSALQEYFAQWKLGGGFNFHCDALRLNAYTGFGYNHFHNKQDPSVGSLSYRYNKLFIPVGILLEACLRQNKIFGVQLEVRPDVYAHMKFLCAKIALKKEYGVRLQTPLTFYLGCENRYALVVVPFFDWNKFGRATQKSSNCMPLPIPQLTRWDLGTRLNFSFAF